MRLEMRDQVLMTWFDEAEAHLRTANRIILYNVPTMAEYNLVRSNQPANLIVFACHQGLL